MLYTVISMFIHHGVWGGRERGPEKKTSVLSWKSQASKKLSTLRRLHTAAESSVEGKKSPARKAIFPDEGGNWKSPSRERVEVANEKEVQARHFRLCFAWEGERGGGGGEEEALETNSQINMIRAISIQHTNGGVIWLCEKDSKEPAGGWLRKTEKHRKKGTEIVK